MKLIIAGSRNITVSPVEIDAALKSAGLYGGQVDEVVSGNAHGVDSCGEAWAKLAGAEIKLFLPDWKAFGAKAGPMRNAEMAEYGDALLLIWDGKSKGSASMRNEARKRGLKIIEVIKT